MGEKIFTEFLYHFHYIKELKSNKSNTILDRHYFSQHLIRQTTITNCRQPLSRPIFETLCTMYTIVTNCDNWSQLVTNNCHLEALVLTRTHKHCDIQINNIQNGRCSGGLAVISYKLLSLATLVAASTSKGIFSDFLFIHF